MVTNVSSRMAKDGLVNRFLTEHVDPNRTKARVVVIGFNSERDVRLKPA